MEKLREMARVNSEKSVSEKIDLGELIRKLLVEMEVPHPDGKDRIILGEMPILQANPVYLQVLFRNLIENALKFRTNNSAVEIDIQSRAINKEMFEITVRDNGIGFENQYAEYIFEPFKRLHTHQNYPGSGMGLTLCQAIVKHYRGNIKASGSPGEGSVFTILLPRLQKESS
jgi:light-regulated signal transduction histidine kinase (bacteriophytochrome)